MYQWRLLLFCFYQTSLTCSVENNTNLKFLNLFFVGRRGLVGLFTTHGAKGRGIESRSFSFFYSFPNQSRRSVRHEKKRKCTKWPATKRVASPRAANQRGKTGRRFRNGYEKGFRFVSKTIKWLTPITRNDMERKNNVLLYFTRST